MKVLTFLFILISTIALGQKDTVKINNNNHYIYSDLMGIGVMGSIGYNYSRLINQKISLQSNIGFGGIFKAKEKYQYLNAVIPNFGVGFTFSFIKGFYGKCGFTIANYLNIYKLKKIQNPEANLIPLSNLFYAPSVGFGFDKNKLNISVNLYKFYQFFSYNSFYPSLRLAYRLNN